MPLGLVSDDMIISKHGIICQNFNSLVPGNFLLLNYRRPLENFHWRGIILGLDVCKFDAFIFSQWIIINISIF